MFKLSKERCIFGFFVLVSVLAAGKILLRVLFELQGTYHSDVAIFLAVSRGLLNGLTLYSDLFENKAPGIFLLGAASLKLFDDPRMFSWLQAIVTAAYPFLLVWGVRRSSRVTQIFAWLIGAVLTLFAAEKGGQVFIEPFAAFFGTAAIVAMLRMRNPPSWSDAMLPAVCLFFALGFKEPMFFSIVGGALIALPSWKHARGIGKPVALVTVAGIAALTLFGFVTAYFMVYVPHIVGYHLFHPWGTVNEPLLLRTADLPRIVENMLTVSPFLPLLIASLWIGALAVLLAQANTRKKQLAAFARWLLASWLITLPVGLTGDFYFHHFVFAVPGYAGLALACLRGWDSIPHARFRQAGIAVLTVLLPLTIWTMPHGEWGGKEEWEREWAGPMRQTGRLLDAVMDACDVDRYFLLVDRPEGLYGFTRHSPYGPIFTQYGRFIGVSPVYLAQFTEALEHAEIAVITTDADTVQMDPHTVQYVEQSFSLQPWPCAKDLSQPLPYRFLFRVGARP